MSQMGFSHDPGPLPFTTIRAAKWANRLVELPVIRITGEHGCSMPRGIAKVAAVEPFYGPCPAHLASVYDGERLVAIRLESPPACADGAHRMDAEWGMCAHCGALQ